MAASLRGGRLELVQRRCQRCGTAGLAQRSGSSSCRRVAARGLGDKLGRELLDVVTAGPKMRKWYGQESALPRDGGEPAAPQQASEAQQPGPAADTGPRDTVLVTDADSPTGELVALQLILRRAKVRILVRDTAAAKAEYGPYAEPVSVDLGSPGGLARALRGVKACIVLGKLGGLLPAAQQAGVERLVLLSTAGMPQPSGLAALFQDAADAGLRDAQREAAVAGASTPHVIVKAGVIRDEPGGSQQLSLRRCSSSSASSSSSSRGSNDSSISREDLASALVASAVHLPGLSGGGAGSGLAFEVSDAGPGRPPADWEPLLEQLAREPAPVPR